MAGNSRWGLGDSSPPAAGAHQEFWFSLKLRVDSPAQLWQAAALRCLSQAELAQDEVEELIGPLHDPSIADCLMILALPERVPGCTRLDTTLRPTGFDAASATAPDAPQLIEDLD